MTFLKTIMGSMDPDFIVAAGFFTASIFIGNYIEKSKVVPVEPYSHYPMKTLKDTLNSFRRQKRSLKKLRRDLLLFEKEINHLKFHRRYIRRVSWYWDEYIDAWQIYNKNRRRYRLIEKYIASANHKSIRYTIDLSAVKYVLMSQSETMHSLYLLKPTLPSVFEPLVFVLVVYFFVVHWKIARDLVLFLLMCNASVAVCLWKRFLYQSHDSYQTTFCNMLYVIYISIKCFFCVWAEAFLGDWDGELKPKCVPRKFKDPEGPIFNYSPLHFWY